MAIEQLQAGCGVGVIISPRDLSFERAQEYAAQYRDLGAEVLVDQQFFIPDASVGHLESYPIHRHRASASQLHQMSDSQLRDFAADLRAINEAVRAGAVIAPAVVFEAGRPDLIDLNIKLFEASRAVANELAIPVYATVVLGRSVTGADETLQRALSAATSVQPDGWYFAFEFDEPRIPASFGAVLRFCSTALTLACSGKPVLNAYAGPLALLSSALGCTAAGVGHSQNLWQFTRARWTAAEAGGGGGGDAPPRYFSRRLWGTIVYEDEFALLTRELRDRVLSPTPFSNGITATPPFLPWSRWDANKHLVHIVGQTVTEMSQARDARDAAARIIGLLTDAIDLHSQIAAAGITLRDETNAYQRPWRAALDSLLASRGTDFEMLQMLREL
jgi:hypothetical protein